jgi:hypothetical protein
MSVNQPEENLSNIEDVKLEEDQVAQFERDLMRAMRRVDAPAGFVDRTMALAAATARPRAKVIAMRPSGRAWISGAIAAALLTGVFVADQARLRHQREEAVVAQQQFEAGVQITGQTLDQVRLQLQEAGIR